MIVRALACSSFSCAVCNVQLTYLRLVAFFGLQVMEQYTQNKLPTEAKRVSNSPRMIFRTKSGQSNHTWHVTRVNVIFIRSVPEQYVNGCNLILASKRELTTTPLQDGVTMEWWYSTTRTRPSLKRFGHLLPRSRRSFQGSRNTDWGSATPSPKSSISSGQSLSPSIGIS